MESNAALLQHRSSCTLKCHILKREHNPCDFQNALVYSMYGMLLHPYSANSGQLIAAGPRNPFQFHSEKQHVYIENLLTLGCFLVVYIAVLWVMTPYNFVCGHNPVRETYCPHLQCALDKHRAIYISCLASYTLAVHLITLCIGQPSPHFTESWND
jgi:hypothetical protein